MIRPLWTLTEVVAACVGQPEYAPGGRGGHADDREAIAGISIDSRSLVSGDLFVPLTDARDGHAFVTSAFGRGAVAALVRQSYLRKPGDGTLIRVDDPLRAMERLGIAARARLPVNARVIAVTGSAGKTGTKEMLRACLKACASSPETVHAPEKSFNNHWGVPLTLARMPRDTGFAVFEIGMNHAGEIRPLAGMVRPHVAIVTNVLPVHVGNFTDGEIGVADAKAEIFEGLEAAGTAIILRDGPHYERLRASAVDRGAGVLSFGAASDADVREIPAEAASEDPHAPQTVVARLKNGERLTFRLGMRGTHLAINSLAVVAALEALGCDVRLAVAALAGVRSAAGRGARETLGTRGHELLLLDESYNANPASMRAALSELARTEPSGRRVAVLGDMLELGAEAVRYHVGLKEAAENADVILCCGVNMRHLYDALAPEKKDAGTWASSSGDLIPHVLATLRPGDAVMVKGSLGSRMAPIVDAIRTRFADA